MTNFQITSGQWDNGTFENFKTEEAARKRLETLHETETDACMIQETASGKYFLDDGQHLASTRTWAGVEMLLKEWGHQQR